MLRHAKLCLALLPFVACNSADDSADLADADFGAEFASLDTSDEAVDFDDPELALPELTGEDPVETDTTLDARPELANARHLRVLVAWGHFRLDPTATDWLDWSGTLTANHAAVRVLSTVRFERPMDHLVARDDIHTIGFVSETAPSYDGLLVDVILHEQLNPNGEAPSLTFTSGPVTHTITLAPDMRRSEVVDVDDAGNKLAFQVFLPDGDGCAEGYLAGVWRSVGETRGGAVGVMKGRFVGEGGIVRGKLRGVYGQRPGGEKVFFAKVIGHRGEFLGLIGGKYGDGKFLGRLHDRGPRIDGVVAGRYWDGDRDHDGSFVGRFSQRCGEETAEGQITSIDAETPVGVIP
jgi:hypothetical protein